MSDVEAAARKRFSERLVMARMLTLQIDQAVFAKRFGLSADEVRRAERGEAEASAKLEGLVTAIEGGDLNAVAAAIAREAETEPVGKTARQRPASTQRPAPPGKRLPACGAPLRKRDGQCKRTDIHPNGRCRFHGGLSKGPTTPEGRARARANLALRWAKRLPEIKGYQTGASRDRE